MLAVQTIVVTFLSALHTIGTLRQSSDMQVLLAEAARDRALDLLDQTSARLSYEEGSYLDIAIRRARERIENAQVRRD